MGKGGARPGAGRPRKGRDRYTFTLAMSSSLEGIRERFELESKGEAVDLAIAALVTLETLQGDRLALDDMSGREAVEGVLREAREWLERVEQRRRESLD